MLLYTVMFDKYLIFITRTPLNIISKAFIKARISANAVTLTGIFSSAGIFICLLNGEFTLALILVLLNRVLDGVDGTIARLTHTKSVSGGFLDIIVDYLFYGSIPLGMAFYLPSSYALAAASVLFTYTLSGVMFMASSSAATSLGINNITFSQKSLYYPINIIEGGESILYSILVCVFPEQFTLWSYIMVGLLIFSLPFRAIHHFRTFKKVEKRKM